MAFDPRCVAFEGRLHADRCTAEYVGRAIHDLDAACFRTSRAVTATACSQMLRVFYFETQIVATSRTPELAANLSPVRINNFDSSVPIRRHAMQDEDTIATIAQDQRRQEEVQAMDMEDVQIPGETVEIPVNFNFILNSRTMQQIRSRINRRRLRRGNERKKFNHKIAVGFIVDKAEQKFPALGVNSSSFTRFFRSNGLMEARVSRRAVKQIMQSILSDVATGDESEEEQETREKKNKYPAILHQDLGKMVNSLAYVGKTGRVICHGREFLQCERYGAGDVVGCGVLLDTNTFFFTLNGKLMGMLAAKDVYDLDNFGEGDVEEESDEDDSESEDDEKDSVGAENGVRTQLNRSDDVDMEDIDGRYEDEKVLFPSVSLHGVGECVRAVFEHDKFQFDLSGFGQQIQKERQRVLLAEREMRSENCSSSDVEQSLCKDEAAINDIVQDFFLYYGYESAYKAFESALVPPKRQRLISDGMEVEYSDEVEASAVMHDVSSVGDTKEEGKIEILGDAQPSLHSLTKQMRESLSLRHEVREHIRCFRTAQALALLEQHVPALMTIGTGYRSRHFSKLMLYCQILCVIDILIHDEEAKAPTSSPSLANGAPHSLRSSNPEEVGCNGWNPEAAIAFARQVFGSSVGLATNGKRKRLELSNGTQKKCVDRHEVALAMSLLLYDQRDSIPKTSHARKFLTSEFRESVANQLNKFLLISDDYGKTEPLVSVLETFMTDLEGLQKACLRQGCCVYPKSIKATSNGKSETTSCRWRASVSSSSDDSSSSQTEQDDRFDDDDNDDE